MEQEGSPEPQAGSPQVDGQVGGVALRNIAPAEGHFSTHHLVANVEQQAVHACQPTPSMF